MQTKHDQIKLICSWASSGDKWTKIHNPSGKSTPGSCGENIIVGYLPTCTGKKDEITIIYQCQLPMPEDHNTKNYQLSSLSFSKWVESMKKINV